jgi:hypothetical protein
MNNLIERIKEETKQNKKTVYVVCGTISLLVIILLGVFIFNILFGDQTEKYLESKAVVTTQFQNLVNKTKVESDGSKRLENAELTAKAMSEEIAKVNCNQVKGSKKIECTGLKSDIKNFLNGSDALLKNIKDNNSKANPELDVLLSDYQATLESLKATLNVR